MINAFDLFAQIQQQEEALLKKVMAQLVGREPVLSDAQRLTKVIPKNAISENSYNYSLLWDGKHIGIVTRTFKENKWTMVFTPNMPERAFKSEV